MYSVGLRHDPNAKQYLPDYINAVKAELVTSSGEPLLAAKHEFEEKLTSYGYDLSHKGLYASGDGILQSTIFPPRLFSVRDLERFTISNFKNNELPATGIVDPATLIRLGPNMFAL